MSPRFDQKKEESSPEGKKEAGRVEFRGPGSERSFFRPGKNKEEGEG